MLHSILGILTLLLTILKWLGLFLLSLLCLLLIVLLLVLLVPVRYRGRVEKTTEKLAGEITGTYLLRLLFVRASVDSGGGRLEIRIAGKPLETWRELLKKRKQRRRSKKTRKSSANVKQGVKRNPAVQKKEEARRNSEVRQDSLQQKAPLKQEPIQRKPEIRQEQVTQKSQTVHEKQKSAAKEKPFSDDKEGAGEKGLDSWIGRIRGVWKSICGLVAGIRKKFTSFWVSFYAMPDKIKAFLTFAEQYEVWELFGEGKKELLKLFSHYRPRYLIGYLKFGTGDPAQTGELTGLLYLLLPTGEYELLPDFEEMRFETETEFSGHLRSIHLLLTAWHLFRNQKLKRLIRKVRKKGE